MISLPCLIHVLAQTSWPGRCVLARTQTQTSWPGHLSLDIMSWPGRLSQDMMSWPGRPDSDVWDGTSWSGRPGQDFASCLRGQDVLTRTFVSYCTSAPSYKFKLTGQRSRSNMKTLFSLLGQRSRTIRSRVKFEGQCTGQGYQDY